MPGVTPLQVLRPKTARNQNSRGLCNFACLGHQTDRPFSEHPAAKRSHVGVGESNKLGKRGVSPELGALRTLN